MDFDLTATSKRSSPRCASQSWS